MNAPKIDPTHKTSQQLLELLAELGIETATTTHAPAMTVEENRAVRGSAAGEDSGRHSKNLFLKNKKGHMWLVVADEDRKIDLKALRKRLGAGNLSFGKAELLLDMLGVEPGSVTPFAAVNDTDLRVQVVLDKALTVAPRVSFHPLVNTQTTTLSSEDLVRFLRHVEHDPLIIDFEEDKEFV